MNINEAYVIETQALTKAYKQGEVVKSINLQVPRHSIFGISVGRDSKGKVSVVLYMIALLLNFVNPWIACAFFGLVAGLWLFLDRRIEKTLTQ